MQDWWADFRQWASQPFADMAEASPLHLFYIIGMICIFAVLWGILINHLFRVIRAI